MRLNLDRARATCATLVLLAVAAWLATPALADSRPAARVSPDWLRDGIVYEVYPRSFSAKGDFNGVTAQLDRLADLGVNVIWLMPVHPIGKLKAKGTLGSPYAVRDYDAVNPEFGTSDDLKRLVAAAHRRGMKVFIDIVANHTAWDSVLIEKHADWYTQDSAGHIVPPNPDWVDVADLDYSKPALRQYMTGMMVRWLREYGIDGFRCDFAGGVPRDFWEAVRPEWDRVRPNLAFLAESDDPALLRNAFDIDYAWDFYHAVSDVLAGRIAASHVRVTWEQAESRYPRGALRLRFSDNHDQLRATGQAGLPAALAASALMYTLDGVPLLYNGMEVGDTGESAAPALFEKVPIRWEMAERRPHVAAYYRELAALRRSHPAFTRGSVRWLHNSDEQRVLSFERSTTGESLVVAINLSSQPYSGSVAVGSGTYQDITPRWHSGQDRWARVPSSRDESGRSAAALPALVLAPWEFRVFRRVAP
jgi:cyclomaltodextrinase / maltogenic alpha-amylase / neopullulanase